MEISKFKPQKYDGMWEKYNLLLSFFQENNLKNIKKECEEACIYFLNLVKFTILIYRAMKTFKVQKISDIFTKIYVQYLKKDTWKGLKKNFCIHRIEVYKLYVFLGNILSGTKPPR